MATQRSRAEKSAIRAAAGMMSTVWLALESAVRERGGNDESISQLNTKQGQYLLGPIADMLVGKGTIVVAQVMWSTLLPWLIAMGKFVSYINPNITAENFPLQPDDLKIKEVITVPIPRAMSTEEVLKYLDSKGMRAATLVELLWWWLTHPSEQSKCLVVIMDCVIRTVRS